MLHLRKLISPLLSASRLPNPSLSPLFSLHRLLSTTAPISPKPFAVEEYLVTTCGLTRAQALKASKKLAHLRSPSKLDAVLSFLSALGLPRSGISAIVAADPQFLCADVEKNLAKRVVELTNLGLSRSQIAHLVPLARSSFRSSSLGPNLGFWLPVFGSFDNVLKALKINSGLLATDLEKVAKPNLALLQQCGIHVCNFPYTFVSLVLSRPPKHVQDAVLHISKFGVQQDSRMFRYALMAFAYQSQEKLAEKIGILERFGWSQDDLLIAVRKMPCVLNMSRERLRRNVEFLTRDVGLEIPYIAQRPVLAMYSLERRLLPRHRLLKVLDAKGLLDAELDFYSAVALTEKKFINRFVRPYKHNVLGLAGAYASSCAGKVPNGFTI